MATMDLLSNKFEAFLEEEMIDCEVPSYIKDNINKSKDIAKVCNDGPCFLYFTFIFYSYFFFCLIY